MASTKFDLNRSRFICTICYSEYPREIEAQMCHKTCAQKAEEVAGEIPDAPVPADEPIPEGAPTEAPDYLIKVYCEHGCYEYTVPTPEQALAHGQAIMASGVYRRVIDGGLEFHKPYKVKAFGPGLESQYTDTFSRT